MVVSTSNGNNVVGYFAVILFLGVRRNQNKVVIANFDVLHFGNQRSDAVKRHNAVAEIFHRQRPLRREKVTVVNTCRKSVFRV